MAFDQHKNLAVSTVVVAPVPPDAGTELAVVAGDAALFPAPPFNATVWSPLSMPTHTTAERVRVTAINAAVFTIERAQGETVAQFVLSGWFIANTVGVEELVAIEQSLSGATGPAGPTGSPGPSGPSGPSGPPGPSEGTLLTFTQGAASAVWVIQHDLNTFPSVTVVDTGDTTVIPDVEYDSANLITLTFGSPTSGKAYLN